MPRPSARGCAAEARGLRQPRARPHPSVPVTSSSPESRHLVTPHVLTSSKLVARPGRVGAKVRLQLSYYLG